MVNKGVGKILQPIYRRVYLTGIQVVIYFFRAVYINDEQPSTDNKIYLILYGSDFGNNAICYYIRVRNITNTR
jgi:hypothetical protein